MSTLTLIPTLYSRRPAPRQDASSLFTRFFIQPPLPKTSPIDRTPRGVARPVLFLQLHRLRMTAGRSRNHRRSTERSAEAVIFATETALSCKVDRAKMTDASERIARADQGFRSGLLSFWITRFLIKKEVPQASLRYLLFRDLQILD